MLSEYKDVRQRDDEGYRRWFSDPYFDVIVWYDRAGGSMTGFQICYDKGQTERAYTWKVEEGIVQSHRFVVNGPVQIGTSKMTSMLKGDAAAIDEAVPVRLRESRGELEPELLGSILARIEDFNRGRAAAQKARA